MAKSIAETIDAFSELGVGDPLVATFESDAGCAALAKMAVDEVMRGVEARLILSVGGRHGERV